MAKTMTPVALAKELKVDPKRLRAYLRANHTRPADKKNTSWALSAAVVNSCRKQFGTAKKTTKRAPKAKVSA